MCYYSEFSNDEAHRPPLPEQNTPETQKTTDILHKTSNSRTGEEISQTEIFSFSRKGGISQSTKNDRRPSKNVVPEQTHEMEVSFRRLTFFIHNFINNLNCTRFCGRLRLVLSDILSAARYWCGTLCVRRPHCLFSNYS